MACSGLIRTRCYPEAAPSSTSEPAGMDSPFRSSRPPTRCGSACPADWSRSTLRAAQVTLTVPLSGRRARQHDPGRAGRAPRRDLGTDRRRLDRGAIDERSGAVTRVGRLSVVGPIAAGGGSLWIADPVYGQVWRFDPKPPHRAHYVTTGLNASGIAYGDGGVWVTSAIDGTPGADRSRHGAHAALLSRQHADRRDRVPGRRAGSDDRRRVGHLCRKQRTARGRRQCRLVRPGDLRRTGTATVRDRRRPQPRHR